MNYSYAFNDRRAAGRALARELRSFAGKPGLVVLALPRGGVPVGYEVAQALHAPLDVFSVRKLGIPGCSEIAMGAIASGGLLVLDTRLAEMLGVMPAEIDRIVRREFGELRRRERAYRDRRPRTGLNGKTILLIDDGLAAGSSMRIAVEALRGADPARIVVAVPVASPQSCERVRSVADDVVCVLSPPEFRAVGAHYIDFRQTTDEEVHALLSAAACNLARWNAA